MGGPSTWTSPWMHRSKLPSTNFYFLSSSVANHAWTGAHSGKITHYWAFVVQGAFSYMNCNFAKHDKAQNAYDRLSLDTLFCNFSSINFSLHWTRCHRGESLSVDLGHFWKYDLLSRSWVSFAVMHMALPHNIDSRQAVFLAFSLFLRNVLWCPSSSVSASLSALQVTSRTSIFCFYSSMITNHYLG